jgi:hypothetical protein
MILAKVSLTVAAVVVAHKAERVDANERIAKFLAPSFV